MGDSRSHSLSVSLKKQEPILAWLPREGNSLWFFLGSDRSPRKGEAVGPPSPKSARCDASENASTEDDAPTPPTRESSSCSTLGGPFRSLFYPAGEGGGAYPARPCRPVKWACSFLVISRHGAAGKTVRVWTRHATSDLQPFSFVPGFQSWRHEDRYLETADRFAIRARGSLRVPVLRD